MALLAMSWYDSFSIATGDTSLTKKLAYGLGLAAMAIAAGCSRGGSGGGDVLAVVNGEPITMDEFHSYLEHKPSVNVMITPALLQALVQRQVSANSVVPLPVPVARGENPYGQSLAFQALTDLVRRKIILQIAKDDGVSPTSGDIEKELSFQTKKDKDFVKRFTQQGFTLDKLRNELTLDLANYNIITKGVTYSPAEVDKYIQEHKDLLKQPPMAGFDIVVVKDAEGKSQVDKALATGDTFRKVATQYTINRNQTSLQGNVDSFPEPLKSIVQKTAEQRASDWFSVAPVEKGKQPDPNKAPFAKIYINRKIAAKDIAVDEVVRTTIERSEKLRIGSKATDIAKRVKDKLKTSKIDVNVPYLSEQWKKEFRDFQNEVDKSSTPQTATGGATAPDAEPAKK